jgi:uncharacterized protein YllA (UPF0747 family)
LLFNITLEYAIRRVQANQKDLKLNGTHQVVVDADDATILGGSLYTVKKNTQAFLVTRIKTGLEVNAEKPKYMVVLRSEWRKES